MSIWHSSAALVFVALAAFFFVVVVVVMSWRADRECQREHEQEMERIRVRGW